MLAMACLLILFFGIGIVVGAFLMIALLTGKTAYVEQAKGSHWADGRYR